tara:strand:- start:306 stop:419 length:114 start_codon:yes stop_codon:yes gene_type:complete
MCENIFGVLVVTGGIFLILAYAWLVGWAAEKIGIRKH